MGKSEAGTVRWNAIWWTESQQENQDDKILFLVLNLALVPMSRVAQATHVTIQLCNRTKEALVPQLFEGRFEIRRQRCRRWFDGLRRIGRQV